MKKKEKREYNENSIPTKLQKLRSYIDEDIKENKNAKLAFEDVFQTSIKAEKESNFIIVICLISVVVLILSLIISYLDDNKKSLENKIINSSEKIYTNNKQNKSYYAGHSIHQKSYINKQDSLFMENLKLSNEIIELKIRLNNSNNDISDMKTKLKMLKDYYGIYIIQKDKISKDKKGHTVINSEFSLPQKNKIDSALRIYPYFKDNVKFNSDGSITIYKNKLHRN